MARQGVDEVVVRVVREFGRPARFRDIAERLASAGISRSQVHNAVYRLKTTGRLNGAGSGAQMTYVVAE